MQARNRNISVQRYVTHVKHDTNVVCPRQPSSTHACTHQIVVIIVMMIVIRKIVIATAIIVMISDMDGCQNYCLFLGTLNIRCRIIIGNQKRTIILTTTHIMQIAITKIRRNLLHSRPGNEEQGT